MGIFTLGKKMTNNAMNNVMNNDQRISDFLSELNEKLRKHTEKNFAGRQPPKMTAKKGRKYTKIIRDDGSVYAFIDPQGNILKPASYVAPVRGNIFADDYGMECCGPYSVR